MAHASPQIHLKGVVRRRPPRAQGIHCGELRVHEGVGSSRRIVRDAIPIAILETKVTEAEALVNSLYCGRLIEGEPAEEVVSSDHGIRGRKHHGISTCILAYASADAEALAAGQKLSAAH